MFRVAAVLEIFVSRLLHLLSDNNFVLFV